MINSILPDIIAGIGFVGFAAGVYMAFGPEYTLIMAGFVLIVLGLMIAWRRNK